ncbi:MAG: diacylglycerol/lipid kinase family protein [Woeseiaceae bacterium]
MTDQTVSLFLNPTAGRGRAGQRVARIKQLFLDSGLQLNVIESCAVGDLESKVAAHVNAGEQIIVVAGGDGSIHEAVNGLLRADESAALGIIPTGTGNDFAKACDITLDWEQACSSLAERIKTNQMLRRIDVGRMNDRYFANGVGIGFEAKVTKVARAYRWPIGDFVYLLAILRCLYDGVATPELAIDAEQIQRRGPVTLTSICNGSWVGGMFNIAPMARNDDGLLELLIAAPVSRLRVLSLLPKLMRGKHMHEPEIEHYSVTSVRITSAAPVESHLDGEVQPLQETFEIEIRAAALDLL